ncbi:hypothetical protein [Microcoleus sp. K4-C2]
MGKIKYDRILPQSANLPISHSPNLPICQSPTLQSRDRPLTYAIQ